VRENRWFESFSVDLISIVKIMNYWNKGMQQTLIFKMVNISKSFLFKFETFLHEKIKIFFNLNPIF
jgi:hypothetical protein